MDNENIYDAAYSETEVSEEGEVKHTFNEEPNKDKKKKKKNNYILYPRYSLIPSRIFTPFKNLHVKSPYKINLYLWF